MSTLSVFVLVLVLLLSSLGGVGEDGAPVDDAAFAVCVAEIRMAAVCNSD